MMVGEGMKIRNYIVICISFIMILNFLFGGLNDYRVEGEIIPVENTQVNIEEQADSNIGIPTLEFSGEIREPLGFPKDVFIEVHRIMELDDIDTGSGADWYYRIGLDEGLGYDWKQSNVPVADNLNHLILDEVFNYTVSTTPVNITIYLCEDDLFSDDLADISEYPGEGVDDFSVYERGAACVVTYDLNTHAWTGDVDGSTSAGYCETNGEWDGADPGVNDAALWFMIWDDTRVDITFPVFGVPLIQQKSNVFDIDVYLESVNGPSNWSAQIVTEYDYYDLQINNIVQNDAHNWTLTVQAPPEARYDLYNLTVTVDGVSDTEPHAVSLIETFSSDFKFIQITDPHIDDPAVQFEHLLGSDHYIESENLSAAIKEINLIDPTFVIASGDIGDNPEGFGQNEVIQYNIAKNCLLELHVPVYILSGNHDNDDDDDEESASITNYWDILNPYPDFSWDYGQYHFIGLDSGDNAAAYPLPGCMMGTGLTNSQINWLQDDLNAHSGSTLKFISMHHTGLDPDGTTTGYNSSISQNQQQFLDICEQNSVSLVFTGHTHEDEIWDIYVQTKPVTHDDPYDEHGYRLIRVSGVSVMDYTYDRDGDGNRDAEFSIVADLLNYSFSPANDGSANKVTATIENDLHEDFFDARLVFKVQKTPVGMQYIAINGSIEQMIECATHDVFYVSTDIPKESMKEVTLQLCHPIDLLNGWNLISLPLEQPDTSINEVLSSIDGKWDRLQVYRAFDPTDHWKSNSTYVPSQLNDIDTLNRTTAIWLHTTEACTLNVWGTVASSTSIPLYAGWNFVGYPSLVENTVSEAFAGTGYTMVEGFNATANYRISQLSDSYLMRPGEGYWVNVPADTVWTVDW